MAVSSRRTTLVMTVAAAVVGAAVAAPIAVFAAHQFTDVAAGHVFHDDIAWLSDNGVTTGCNPPANTRYCPEENVTRGQMAAFLRRLAEGQVVDAATVGGRSADELEGAAGPPGPTGPAGPEGPPGPAGIVDIYVVTESRPASDIASDVGSASCEEGDMAISGGHRMTSVQTESARVVSSYPSGSGFQHWNIFLSQFPDGNWTVYAICVDFG